MKVVKTLTILSIITLLLESSVFFALDRYYKSTLLNTKTTEVRILDNKKVNKNVDVFVPNDATKLSASYDCKYISYYENNQLIVVNTANGVKNTVSLSSGYSRIYANWLPDIDSIILCEVKSSEKDIIEIYKYNADNNIKQAPTDTNNNPIKLQLNSERDKIEDIEYSTIMGIFYAKVLKTNGRNYILYNDVNGQTTSMLNSQNIGSIKAFDDKFGFIYEDLDNGGIKYSETKNIVYTENAYLLGIDGNDNIYIGIGNNNVVTKILYGTMEQKSSNWQTINLNASADKNNINITAEGKVLINNSLEHYILDAESNKKISYSGDFIKVTSSNLIFVSGGKIQNKQIQ